MLLYTNDFIVLNKAIYTEILLQVARDHNIPNEVALDMATDFFKKLRELNDESYC